MDIKDAQEKLRALRARLREQGTVSVADEMEIKSVLKNSLVSARGELEQVQMILDTIAARQKANQDGFLSADQKTRLEWIEKSGSGSRSVH